MRVEYREEPCRSALNRVKGMPFDWSLNPYTGCAHRCTFCYVRAFEARADRPSDDRYGRSIRVKVNVADVLRGELARPVVEARERRGRGGDRPVPAGGGTLPPDARVHPRARHGTDAVLPHHARADGQARRRRAGRRRTAGEGARQLLRPDARRAHLAGDGAGHRTSAPPSRDGPDPRRGGDRHGGRARPDPPRALGRPRSFSRMSSARPVPPARAGSGRTCSTFARERGSTSSRRSRVTGRSCCPTTSGSTRDAPIFRRARSSRCGRPSASSRGARGGPGDRRSGPTPQPEQLALAVCRPREGVQPRLVESRLVAENGEITVLIADDHEVVREGLRLALLRSPHIRVVGEAPDGETAVALAERRRPDVVIMDLRMPQMDGIEATEEIVARVPGHARARVHGLQRARAAPARPRVGRARLRAQGGTRTTRCSRRSRRSRRARRSSTPR